MVDDKLWVLAHSHHPGEKQHGRIMLLVFSWPGAVLSVGPTRLRLVRAGVVDAPLEKNWIPFVDDMGQVRVSYQIEPHIVLTCGSPSGACVILYNTSAASLWHRRCSDRIAKRLLDHHPVNPSMVRGGTTCVTGVVPGEHVCIGHWHNNYASYYHWFYSFSSRWPHLILHVSYPFRFAPHFRDGAERGGENKDRVQFAAGLAQKNETTLTITYGIGDCVAAEMAVPVSDVTDMLAGTLIKLLL